MLFKVSVFLGGGGRGGFGFCVRVCVRNLAANHFPRGYGAMAERLTPDQKIGRSNLSALIQKILGSKAHRAGTGAGEGGRGREKKKMFAFFP